MRARNERRLMGSKGRPVGAAFRFPATLLWPLRTLRGWQFRTVSPFFNSAIQIRIVLFQNCRRDVALMIWRPVIVHSIHQKIIRNHSRHRVDGSIPPCLGYRFHIECRYTLLMALVWSVLYFCLVNFLQRRTRLLSCRTLGMIFHFGP